MWCCWFVLLLDHLCIQQASQLSGEHDITTNTWAEAHVGLKHHPNGRHESGQRSQTRFHNYRISFLRQPLRCDVGVLMKWPTQQRNRSRVQTASSGFFSVLGQLYKTTTCVKHLWLVVKADDRCWRDSSHAKFRNKVDGLNIAEKFVSSARGVINFGMYLLLLHININTT